MLHVLENVIKPTTVCFVQTFAPPDYLAHLPTCDMKFGGSAPLQVSPQCFLGHAYCPKHSKQLSCCKLANLIWQTLTLLLFLLLGEQKEYERVRHGRKSAPALDIKR